MREASFTPIQNLWLNTPNRHKYLPQTLPSQLPFNAEYLLTLQAERIARHEIAVSNGKMIGDE
jgi:hypothetical protein